MANEQIRKAARTAGIPLWRIAVAMGISEPTLTRWLRVPLTTDKKRKILVLISKLEQEGTE